MQREIILAGGMRTPFGDFGKSLKDTPLADLGIYVTKVCLDKAGPKAGQVDQEGYLAARYIAIESGLPVESATINVSRTCSSGSQGIITATKQILSGHSEVAVADGGENSSRAHFAVTTGRWGHKRGPQTMVDTLDWAYCDPFRLQLMGETAKKLAEDNQYQRALMDGYALTSQKRAGAARDLLSGHITPIEVRERKTTRIMVEDEYPRPQVTLEKLSGMQHLVESGQDKAVISMCMGAGQGLAMLIERVRH